MPTVYNLARMAADCYTPQRSGPCGGLPWWTCGYIADSPCGFQGALYQNSNTGKREAVIAFRGTEPARGADLWADLQIGAHMMPGQMLAAWDAFTRWHARMDGAGFEVWLAGHSLGGALAGMVAFMESVPCVTFNAPGYKLALLADTFVASGLSATRKRAQAARILNVRNSHDPVSRVNIPIGRTETVAGWATHENIIDRGNVLTGSTGMSVHSMDRLASLVGLQPWGHQAPVF